MNARRNIALAAALLALSLPTAANAQDSAPTLNQPALSAYSIGINAGMFLRPIDDLLSIGGDGLLVYGPNVTLNMSRSSAIQLTSSVVGERNEYSNGTVVFYAVQYRRTFRDQGKSRTYWTVGGAGTVTHTHYQERTFTGPNFYGFVRADDVTYHSDARTSTRMMAPVIPVVGFGTERFVHRRLAIRGDVVLSFLALRAAVGLSVPVGRLK